MALDTSLDSLDSLPEAIHEHYTKGEDGKYALAVNTTDGRVLENVDGLKSALTHEKNDNKANKAIIAEHVTTIETRNATIATFKDENKNFDEKVNAASDARISEMQKDIEAKETAWKDSDAKKDMAIRGYAIDTAALQAIERHKGNPKLLLREVKAAADIVMGQDGSMHVVIKDEQGNPRYDDPVKGTYMDIEGFVSEMKKDDDWALAFDGSGAAGSGSRGSDRSTARTGQPKHRGDFPDVKTKAAWCRENGQEAFEKLPMAPRP